MLDSVSDPLISDEHRSLTRLRGAQEDFDSRDKELSYYTHAQPATRLHPPNRHIKHIHICVRAHTETNDGFCSASSSSCSTLSFCTYRERWTAQLYGLCASPMMSLDNLYDLSYVPFPVKLT